MESSHNYTDEYKLAYFNNKALQVAKETRNEIMDEIEITRNEYITKQVAALDEELAAKEVETEKVLFKEINKQKSDLLMQHKRALLQMKEDFKKSTFEKVAKMLLTYRNSGEYLSFLYKLADLCVETLHHDFILSLSPEDEGISDKLSERIKTKLSQSGSSANFTITYDKSIKYGGLRITCESDGVLINETLDERFENGKLSFSESLSEQSYSV